MAELPQSEAEVRSRKLGTSRFTSQDQEIDFEKITAQSGRKFGFLDFFRSKQDRKQGQIDAFQRGLEDAFRALKKSG